MQKLSHLIKDLQERKVFRIASVYVVTMWIIIQGASDLFPVFGFPDWTIRFIVVLAIIGFPISVVLGWAYQVTPDGFVRDTGHEHTPAPGHRGRGIDFVIIGALVVLVAFLLFREQFMPGPEATVESTAQAQPATPGAAPATVATHPQSIGVLPFLNMSSNPDTEYFSDGISEEILNVLANIPGLQVASRTSAFSFKGTAADIPTVAQKLGVSFVLEGSVRRAGDTVRITAQLIDARKDQHVWSETYDRELTDIFAVQDEISAAIVDKLQPTVFAARGGGTKPRPNRSRTQDMEAYDLYLKGRSAFSESDPEALRSSIGFLEASIEHDPQFARSYSALARSQLALSEIEDDGAQMFESALQSARTAVSLDNSLREAQMILIENEPL